MPFQGLLSFCQMLDMTTDWFLEGYVYVVTFGIPVMASSTGARHRAGQAGSARCVLIQFEFQLNHMISIYNL